VDPNAIERASAVLLDARRTGRKIAGLPPDAQPKSLEEAYAISSHLQARLDKKLAGWFMACTNPAMQKAHGLPGPYFGRAFESDLNDSPARIAMGGAPRWSLEIEFVFRMAHDLPPRSAAYSREEVAAAVGALHAALEFVDSHFTDLLTANGFSIVADNGTEGIYVIGPPVSAWQKVDRAALRVALHKNGQHLAYGGGAHVMGDPLNALHWCANELSKRGLGMKAGEIVGTGNSLERYCFGAAGDEIMASCGPFGEIRATLTP
jgi:2-keto-4-pentenoate hydratase